MKHKTGVRGNPLYSPIPLEDFKAVLGLDDREDALSRYCLMTATFTIEQYCRRRLFLKQYHELIESYGDMYVPLREYPIRKVLAVYAYGSTAEPELIEPGCYSLCPEIEEWLDMPHTLRLSPTVGRRFPGVSAFKAVYQAGYSPGEAGDPYRIPADLASACLELAAWNMSRYRGKRIGMTGNIRGSGKDGEHLEASIPENVRGLLEPYRRRTI